MENEIAPGLDIIKQLEEKIKNFEYKLNYVNISRLYEHYLNREPSKIELDYWISELDTKKISIETLPDIIGNSEEAQREHTRKLIIERGFVSDGELISKKFGGHTIYLDPKDLPLVESLSQPELYETTTATLIKKVFKSGMNVINIGANIGFFTLLLAKQVGTKGRVFAFEPSHKTSKILKKNIEENKYENVKIIVQAVSNTTGFSDMWTGKSSTHNYVSSELSKDTNLHREKIKTITIDEFFVKDDFRIDFIVMDAEGSEKSILEGARKTIMKNKDLEIITEYNPHTLTLAGTSGQEFFKLIEELGFFIYLIDEKTSRVKLSSSSEVLNQYVSPNVVNLYLTRRKDLGQYIE